MRILHVITSLGTGGAQGQLARLVSAPKPAADRERVVSLLRGGPMADAIRSAGGDVQELGARRGVASVGPALRLRKELLAFQPDCVVSWLYHANLYSLLAMVLAQVSPGRRLVWNIRGTALDPRPYGLSHRLSVQLGIRFSSIPAAIVSNSEAGRQDHVSLGYNPRRWVIIANGVDTAEFRPDQIDRQRMRKMLGLRDEDKLAILAGRNDPQKDISNFLTALEQIPDLRAVAVGKGTDALPTHARLIRLGERLDMPSVYRAADLLVSSSAYGEGFSNVVAEAMASGLPVVATDIGDARAIIGEFGMIVPARDPSSLAAAIAAMLQLDPNARLQLGMAGRERVDRLFSMDRAIAAYRDLYASLGAD